MTALTADTAGRHWPRAAYLLLLILMAAGALLWLVTHERQRGWEGPPLVEVTLSGDRYRLAPEQAEGLVRLSALHFTEGEEAARALAAEEVARQLDQAFGGARQRLPEFADWYYSLSGEYARLVMTALSWVELADADYVAGRAAEILFPQEVWSTDLARVQRETALRLEAHDAQVREGWLAVLTERLSAHRVPAPLPGARQDVAADQVALDGLLAQLVERERAAFETRATISSVAAGGAAAGPAVWRAVTRSRAAFGRVLTRGAGRGAARAGSAAAGGAAVCSPGGPLAVGCAVVAGAATWLAADWVLLRIDEQANRDEMMQALESGLDTLRSELEQDLLLVYDALIDAHYGGVRADIERTFVPAKAFGPAR